MEEIPVNQEFDPPIGLGPGRGARTLVALAVACLTFVAFLPTLQNGFVNYDDDANLVLNKHYKGLGWANLAWMFTTFHLGPYQPLSWLTYAIDYELWGDKPVGYHLTSLLLHSASAGLLFLLSLHFAQIAFGARPRGKDFLACAIAVLFFSVHPLRVESVAWATERRDVLSGFFFLLAVLAYLRAGERRTEAPGAYGKLVPAIVFYALSLASKATAMTAPVILLLLDVYPLRRLPAAPWRWFAAPYRRVITEKIPFLALAIAAGALAVVGQSRSEALREHLGFADRLGVAAFATVFYLRKAVFPAGLYPLYELRPEFHALSAPVIVSAASLLAITAALVAFRRRRPALLVTWIAYLGLLSPVSGVVPIGLHLAADRYTYLPLMAWSVLLAGGLMQLFSYLRTRGGTAGRYALAGGLIAVLAAFGALTWRQSRVWRDSKTLWEHTLAQDGRSSVAHLNLGAALYDAGKRDEGEAHYREALHLRPRYARAYNNLGRALLEKGDPKAATELFATAVKLEPKLAQAHYNLGTALLRQGEPAKAVKALEEALRIDPDLSEAQVNIAVSYLASGEIDKAQHEYEAARARDPDDGDSLYNLATIHLRRDETSRAIELYRKSIHARPDFAPAHFNLGNALLRAGRADEAIGAFREAIRLEPKSAGAYVNLAAAYLGKGDASNAIATYEAVLRVQPELAIAHYNLGLTLLGAKRFQKAAGEFREALKTNAEDSDTHYHLAVALYYLTEYALAREHVERARALGRRLDPRFLEALDAASSRPASAPSPPSR
ncbi:MAG: tetratricopeptide repeat protein [Planctomycetota bacterium]